jgi:hypothetical protein
LVVVAPQLETGSVATSYIPTVAFSATRNADVISKTGVSGFIGQTEGSLYAEVDLRNLGVTRRILTLSDNSAANRIRINFDATAVVFCDVVASSATQASFTSATVSGVVKIALGYAVNDFVLYVNGTQIGTDTSGTIPATSQINIGASESGAAQLNDRIRAAAIYPTRLTNAQLSSLTTL